MDNSPNEMLPDPQGSLLKQINDVISFSVRERLCWHNTDNQSELSTGAIFHAEFTKIMQQALAMEHSVTMYKP